MALTFTGSGGLFTRTGKYGRVLNVLNRFRGDSSITLGDSAVITDLGTEIADLQDEYAGATVKIRQQVDELQKSGKSAVDGLSSFTSRLQAAARAALIQQVNADVALSSQSDLTPALEEVIRQMVSGAYYVGSPTISGTATAGSSNYGNGDMRVSLVDGRGRATANVFAETLLAVLADTTQPTLGSERFAIKGVASVGSPLSYLWPGGSAASVTVQAVAPDASGSKVTNGDFEDFTANVPDNWTMAVGTAGTTVIGNAVAQFAGSKCLEIVGNGSQLTELTYTLTGLLPLTPYAVGFRCKNSANPSTGVLTVSLYDGSGTITNEAGTNNAFTIDLTTLGTSYVAKGGFFQLPDPVPSTVKLRIKVTTAIENAKSLYIDHLAFQEATELYTHGPWVAYFSGSLANALLDTWSIAIANNRSGKWQELFNRLFDMRSKQLLLPTSGSTLISETLLA